MRTTKRPGNLLALCGGVIFAAQDIVLMEARWINPNFTNSVSVWGSISLVFLHFFVGLIISSVIALVVVFLLKIWTGSFAAVVYSLSSGIVFGTVSFTLANSTATGVIIVVVLASFLFGCVALVAIKMKIKSGS